MFHEFDNEITQILVLQQQKYFDLRGIKLYLNKSLCFNLLDLK